MVLSPELRFQTGNLIRAITDVSKDLVHYFILLRCSTVIGLLKLFLAISFKILVKPDLDNEIESYNPKKNQNFLFSPRLILEILRYRA